MIRLHSRCPDSSESLNFLKNSSINQLLILAINLLRRIVPYYFPILYILVK